MEARAWPAFVFAVVIGAAGIGLLLRYVAFVWWANPDDFGFEAFATAQCHWDCTWFVEIAEGGYDGFPVPGRRNVGNWAFFPLYPSLVGLVASVSPLSTIATATLLSSVVTMGACLLAWPLTNYNPRAYSLCCIFFLAGPFSVYFSTLLSEPLFLLLTAATFLAIKRRAWVGAGLACAALSATRVVGVLAVFATLTQMLRDHLSGGGRLSRFPSTLIARPDLLVAIFVSPLGLFAYMLFLHETVGDALAFSHIQRAFGRMFGDPSTFMLTALTDRPEPGLWFSPRQLSALAALVGIGLTGLLVLRRRYAEATFAALCVVIPIAGGLYSMVRYMAGTMPLVLLAGQEIGRSREATVLTGVAMLAACPFVTYAWMDADVALV